MHQRAIIIIATTLTLIQNKSHWEKSIFFSIASRCSRWLLRLSYRLFLPNCVCRFAGFPVPVYVRHCLFMRWFVRWFVPNEPSSDRDFHASSIDKRQKIVWRTHHPAPTHPRLPSALSLSFLVLCVQFALSIHSYQPFFSSSHSIFFFSPVSLTFSFSFLHLYLLFFVPSFSFPLSFLSLFLFSSSLLLFFSSRHFASVSAKFSASPNPLLDTFRYAANTSLPLLPSQYQCTCKRFQTNAMWRCTLQTVHLGQFQSISFFSSAFIRYRVINLDWQKVVSFYS